MRNPRLVTVLYRIVAEVINVTFIVTLVADGGFPKASRPNASFSLLQAPRLKAGGGMRFTFPPYDCWDKMEKIGLLPLFPKIIWD